MPDGTESTTAGAQSTPEQTTVTFTAAEQGTAQGDATQGQRTTGQNGGEDKRFTQAEVDDLIKQRLERERRRQEAQAQQEREAAETRRREENQEFQALAEERKTKLDALEPIVEKANRYEEAIKSLLKEERKSVPEYVHSILNKLDPAEQLEWIAANREQFTAQQSTQAPTGTSTATRALPQTPKAAAPMAPGDLVAAATERLRNTGEYHRLG